MLETTSLPSIPTALCERLRVARHVTVLTGAGISAESGIPTFRDPRTGLWAKYDFADLATRAGFKRNPQLVWDWTTELHATMVRAEPNPAHRALVAMENALPAFTLLTQNVDNLHQRAGSRNMWELHGNITRYKCFEEDLPVDTWPATDERPPRCTRCGGHIRHDIVWFGELLSTTVLAAAEQALQTCDVFFAIGTSFEVHPASTFARRASQHGAIIVIISLDITNYAAPDLYRFNAPAGCMLPALVQATWPEAAV